MFIEHVYVQCAAETNLHTYIYEMSFGEFEVLSAVLLQFPVRTPATGAVKSHCCSFESDPHTPVP